MTNLIKNHTWAKETKLIFNTRMVELINYYGKELIETGLNGIKMKHPIPARDSFWLTSEKDYDVMKMHLENLELTVGSEVFYLGCICFFDMEIAV